MLADRIQLYSKRLSNLQQQELLEAGDESQAYCDMGTEEVMQSNVDDVQFPTLDEVMDEGGSDTIPFKLVEENIVYRIVEARNVTTRNGDTMVLTLKDQAGTVVKCYTSSLVEREMNRLMQVMRGEGKDVHFLTKLRSKKAKDSGNTYYDFKITTREKKCIQ